MNDSWTIFLLLPLKYSLQKKIFFEWVIRVERFSPYMLMEKIFLFFSFGSLQMGLIQVTYTRNCLDNNKMMQLVGNH